MKLKNIQIYKFFIFLVLLSTFYFLYSSSVVAVDYLPLVPCGLKSQDNPSTPEIEGACTRCDSFKLAHNVISFILYGLVPPVAAVLFIYGGLVILLAGARLEWISHGKKVFWNTFLGLVIIMASWLIVNTFIQSFGPEQAKDSWFRFTCSEKGAITPGGQPPPTALCSDPTGLAAQNSVPYPRQNAP